MNTFEFLFKNKLDIGMNQKKKDKGKRKAMVHLCMLVIQNPEILPHSDGRYDFWILSPGRPSRIKQEEMKCGNKVSLVNEEHCDEREYGNARVQTRFPFWSRLQCPPEDAVKGKSIIYGCRSLNVRYKKKD